jgi:hypothetical protein
MALGFFESFAAICRQEQPLALIVGSQLEFRQVGFASCGAYYFPLLLLPYICFAILLGIAQLLSKAGKLCLSACCAQK